MHSAPEDGGRGGGVKADSAADDNSQQSAAAAELFRKINDFFNPILKWVSTMDNSEKSETSEVQVLTKLG